MEPREYPLATYRQASYVTAAAAASSNNFEGGRVVGAREDDFRARSIVAGIPNLIGPSRAHALQSIVFRLGMRQQPQAARACGFSDKDRRVIDPPPIVELSIESPFLTENEIKSYLRYESYVMNCCICDETGTKDASFMPEEYQHQRRLMGSSAGTPFAGQDENGQEGCFFCFSDLSCRTPGAFRLKFTLIMIDPPRAGQVRHFPVLAEVLSDVFHVYSAKEFPGMLPSSALARRLRQQGCIISVRKGNERARSSIVTRFQDGITDEDEEDDNVNAEQQERDEGGFKTRQKRKSSSSRARRT